MHGKILSSTAWNATFNRKCEAAYARSQNWIGSLSKGSVPVIFIFLVQHYPIVSTGCLGDIYYARNNTCNASRACSWCDVNQSSYCDSIYQVDSNHQESYTSLSFNAYTHTGHHADAKTGF